MNFTVEQKAFATTIAAVLPAIERRNTIPVLSCIKIEVRDNVLTLAATNLDVEAVATCTADVSMAGACVASGVDVSAWVTSVSAGALVSAELTDKMLVMAAGRLSIKVPLDFVDDFPIMKPVAEMVECIGAIDAMVKCLPFASDEQSRYYLNGVFLDGDTAVATNGHVLRTSPISGGCGVIIPRESIPMIAKNGGRFYACKTAWRVENEGRRITGKVIDGTFPDYNRVIPKAADPVFSFDADEMMAAIDAATLGRASAVAISGHGDHIHLTGRLFDLCQVAPEADCAGEAQERRVTLSRKYITETLKSFAGGVVDMTWANVGDALRVTCNGRDGVAVVMPQRDVEAP